MEIYKLILIVIFLISGVIGWRKGIDFENENHAAFAFTWTFLFAIVLLVILGYYLFIENGWLFYKI